jgi:hypothetical protein
MQDVTKMTEITEAQNTVRVLTERLNAANLYLSRYMVEFDARVNSDNLDIEISVKKPLNGGGMIKTIPKEISLYYKNDVSSLAETICEEIFLVLLKNELKKDLMQELTRAVVNVALMDSKK